jgi:aspartate aminotransferase
MKPAISDRARSLPESPIRKLAPYAEAAVRRGVKVYHLNIGQPDLETPLCMRSQLAKVDSPIFAYTPSRGTPEFLESLRHYYQKLGIELETSQILATTGGSEALLFAFLACANAGDEMIVPEPFYANYRAFAAMAGLRLVPIRMRGDDGFHLPPRHRWESIVTPSTRFVLLCNPNNPTGTVYRREELLEVASFCRDHGLFLISDEVYREFVYDGAKATSLLELEEYRDLVIVVDSLSKRYSACGIRLGALITRNEELFGAALKMAQARLSAPGIAQLIATAANELGPEYTEEIVREYQKRRDILFRGLGSLDGVFFRKPEGAFYFVARFPVDDAEEFARWLLADFEHEGATVMLSPASGFYQTEGAGNNEVRIAYVLNGDDLERAVEILREALRVYPAVQSRAEPAASIAASK